MMAFWMFTPCSAKGLFQRFKTMCASILNANEFRYPKMEAVHSSKTVEQIHYTT
jgi:hypothetical protein